MSEAAPEGRLVDVAGAVLLGGASQRMGLDKAGLAFAGEVLATRTARLLAGLFDEVLLVGGTPPEGAPGRHVADPEGPRCALRGLLGALRAARAERVLVVATDMPGLRPELLLALVAAPEAECVAPRTARGLEPLCALYRREPALRRADAALRAGRLAMRDLLGELDVVPLEDPVLRALDPSGRALANVNTPEELEAFRRGAGCATME